MWVFLFNFGSMETAIVKRAFTCVNSRVYYAIGSTYAADETRINHLVNKGYVTALPKAHIPKAEVAPPSATLTHADLKELPQSEKPKKKRNEHK